MRIGFVVNPIAGMGGRVGLKGTDKKVETAVARGAEPRAPDRARRALDQLQNRRPEATILTYDDPMGASLVREAGYDPVVVGAPGGRDEGTTTGTSPTDDNAALMSTSPEDTRRAVETFLDEAVDLVLFVGGDGTAADVAGVIQAAGETDADGTPMLGIPAGVKVYSSVFAVSPEDAATITATFDRIEQREVMDINEEAYRDGEVNPELRAVVAVPVAEQLQSAKSRVGGSVEAVTKGVAMDVRAEPERTYLFGPGSTVQTSESELNIDATPLGIDVWRDGELLIADATEQQILDNLSEDNVIVVSPIGGQGFVFGRGNPQFSPAVIRQCEVRIVASPSKIDQLGQLRVDTDDPDLDEELQGWWRVRVGKYQTRLMQII
jgi:predicted polyphosphate/ATP-dependent NAD kinase